MFTLFMVLDPVARPQGRQMSGADPLGLPVKAEVPCGLYSRTGMYMCRLCVQWEKKTRENRGAVAGAEGAACRAVIC